VKGRHDADRRAVRHGTGTGSVTLGGRRVPVARRRVRALDGSGELPVPAYELFSGTEVLGRMAMERMLAGLSTQKYPVGLEPVGRAVAEQASSTEVVCEQRPCSWRQGRRGCVSALPGTRRRHRIVGLVR